MSSFLTFEAFHHFKHASNDQNQIETDRYFLSRIVWLLNKNYYYINSMHHAREKGKKPLEKKRGLQCFSSSSQKCQENVE